MPITYSTSTISTSTTPVQVFPNQTADGNLFYYINFTGANLMSADTIIDAGNMNYLTTTGNVSTDGFGHATIYIPPDYTAAMYMNYVYTGPTANGFYVSSDNPIDGVSITASLIPRIFTGSVTTNNIYQSSGVIEGPKTWVGSASTTSTGTFSVDISSAAFATILSVNSTALNNTSTATAVPLASLNTVSTTTVTGNVVDASSTGAAFVGSGITVYVNVVGY